MSRTISINLRKNLTTKARSTSTIYLSRWIVSRREWTYLFAERNCRGRPEPDIVSQIPMYVEKLSKTSVSENRGTIRILRTVGNNRAHSVITKMNICDCIPFNTYGWIGHWIETRSNVVQKDYSYSFPWSLLVGIMNTSHTRPPIMQYVVCIGKKIRPRFEYSVHALTRPSSNVNWCIVYKVESHHINAFQNTNNKITTMWEGGRPLRPLLALKIFLLLFLY